MAVLDVAVIPNRGGTSCELIIAHVRTRRGDLRRPDAGGRRWAPRARHAHGPPGPRSAGEPDGAPRWSRRRGPSGAKAAHLGGGDPGRSDPHRPRRSPARRSDPPGPAVSGDGAFDGVITKTCGCT